MPDLNYFISHPSGVNSKNNRQFDSQVNGFDMGDTDLTYHKIRNSPATNQINGSVSSFAISDFTSKIKKFQYGQSKSPNTEGSKYSNNNTNFYQK